MKKINGINLDLEYLPKFHWVSDIQYYDGALMAEYSNEMGELYIFHWCDCSDKLNRWLVTRVNRRSLYELTSGLISIRDFLMFRVLDKNVYVLDIDSDECIVTAYMVHLEKVPEEYYPDEDIYISPELSPVKEMTSYPVLIDKYWSEKELSDFPRKFMDAYSIIHRYVCGSSKGVDEVLTLYPWKGGYSSTAFYTTLRSELKRSLGINAIQYASPGYVDFTADRNVALLVKKNVDVYIKNKDKIDEFFRSISNYMSENKLNDERAMPDSIQEKWLFNYGEKLMQYFSEPSWQWLLSNTPDVFRAVKISMSYYRRIKPLSKYVTSNMTEFGEI